MHALDAVAGTLAMEIVSLHDTREAATLRQTDQIDAGDLIQYRDIDDLTHFEIVLFTVRPKLSHEPLRLATGLLNRSSPLLVRASAGGR